MEWAAVPREPASQAHLGAGAEPERWETRRDRFFRLHPSRSSSGCPDALGQAPHLEAIRGPWQVRVLLLHFSPPPECLRLGGVAHCTSGG